MKKYYAILIFIVFINPLNAQLNTLTVSKKIIAINKTVAEYLQANPVVSKDSIKKEMTALTGDAGFAEAVLKSDFWDYTKPGLKEINEKCEKLITPDNDPGTYPYLANIFSGSSRMTIFGFDGGSIKNSILGAIPAEEIIIQGIVNFVAKRFKKEIELGFFRKFRDFLTQNTTMGVLYPKTVQIFTYDNAMFIEQFSNTLQTAFTIDLQNLPKNLVKEIETPTANSWFASQQSNDTLKSLFLLGNKYTNLLEKGNNPKESMESLLPAADANAKPFLQYILLYMTHLQEGDHWVNPVNFNEGLNAVFSALLYLNNKTLYKQNIIENDKNEYKKYAFQFTNKLQDFNIAIAKYQLRETNKDFTLQDYLQYLEVYNNLLTVSGNLLNYNDTARVAGLAGTKNLGQTALHGTGLLELSNELNRNLLEMKITAKEGNYSLVISNANYIITSLYKDADIEDKTDKKIKKLNELLPKMLFYGTFISEFCASKDEKAIENLLNKFAMPAGGYSVKNKRNCTLMIDSYVGANLGYENFVQTDRTKSKTYEAPFISLFAPIGLELAIKSKTHNLGLYLPIIDIGTPLSFRLGNTADSLKVLPELSFKNIIAPGVFLKYGAANSPFAILIGAKMAPRLRKLDGDVVFEANRGWRYGISIAADLTLFKLLVSKK